MFIPICKKNVLKTHRFVKLSVILILRLKCILLNETYVYICKNKEKLYQNLKSISKHTFLFQSVKNHVLVYNLYT